MLPIWSERQGTVLVADRVVYMAHICSHLGNNVSAEFSGPRLRPPCCQRRSLCLFPAASDASGFSWARFAKFK